MTYIHPCGNALATQVVADNPELVQKVRSTFGQFAEVKPAPSKLVGPVDSPRGLEENYDAAAVHEADDLQDLTERVHRNVKVVESQLVKMDQADLTVSDDDRATAVTSAEREFRRLEASEQKVSDYRIRYSHWHPELPAEFDETREWARSKLTEVSEGLCKHRTKMEQRKGEVRRRQDAISRGLSGQRIPVFDGDCLTYLTWEKSVKELTEGHPSHELRMYATRQSIKNIEALNLIRSCSTVEEALKILR